MRTIILLVSVLMIVSSCKQQPESKELILENTANILVAKDIIYDVVVQAENDDPWELEKVAGFKGGEMIDDIFEGLYKGSLIARDYHTGKELSINDIKKIEKKPGFDRSNIGKIQFTEDWYYDPDNNGLEKKVRMVVFGYRTASDDIERVGYMAAFEVIL